MTGAGQYAVGTDPCANGFGREAIAAAGELIMLRPAQSRRYRIGVAIAGAEEADGCAAGPACPEVRRDANRPRSAPDLF